MARFLDRLGRACAHHKWRTIGIWFLVAVALGVSGKVAGGRTVDVFTIPGAQSQQAVDLLKERFPSQSGDTANIVVRAREGKLTDPQRAQAIAAIQARVARLAHVGKTTASVVGPATPLIGSKFVSSNGAIGYVRVQYDEAATSLPPETFKQLKAAARPASQAQLGVEFGGPLTDYFNRDESGNADEIGLLVAVVVLLVAFGSVVAMSLPIGTALFGLTMGLAGISLLASVTDVGTTAPVLATMIGLGVGIDYSLFIVTRYRQDLAEGMEPLEAIGVANGTAGQSVLFAGTTVVIAILGLAIAGIPYVTRLGITSAIVVAVMMTAAVTLLPGLLGLVGRHIDSLSIRRLFRRSAKTSTTTEGGGWERWATAMSHHRWAAMIVSVVILVALTAPLVSMRLGQTDDGTEPTTSTQRRAFDLLEQGFGQGSNGPLVLAVELPKAGDTRAATAVQQAVARVPGVRVAPAQLSPGQDAAVITVIPPADPDSLSTQNLVNKLRTTTLPAAVKGTGAKVYVGGATAAYIDLGERILDRLPLFIGAVVLLSFVLLMMVFRSIFVPLKAAIMNLLSIGASYGVIVAVFQWGWFKGIFGLQQTTPIVAFVPMMMFAILFGLSMDYEVFLLSRIREEYTKTGDNLHSVIDGLAHTARVITAAALIMISVFLSFVSNPNPTVKMFGLGLAVAIFVDATLVRLVLVPATMELLGDANWWLPKWIDRLLPHISLEEIPPSESPSPPPQRRPRRRPHRHRLRGRPSPRSANRSRWRSRSAVGGRQRDRCRQGQVA